MNASRPGYFSDVCELIFHSTSRKSGNEYSKQPATATIPIRFSSTTRAAYAFHGRCNISSPPAALSCRTSDLDKYFLCRFRVLTPFSLCCAAHTPLDSKMREHCDNNMQLGQHMTWETPVKRFHAVGIFSSSNQRQEGLAVSTFRAPLCQCSHTPASCNMGSSEVPLCLTPPWLVLPTMTATLANSEKAIPLK